MSTFSESHGTWKVPAIFGGQKFVERAGCMAWRHVERIVLDLILETEPAVPVLGDVNAINAQRRIRNAVLLFQMCTRPAIDWSKQVKILSIS